VEPTGRPPPTPEWRPLAELCQRVAEDLPALAATITDRIRTENPVYEPVARDDQLVFIREQARQLLTGLAACRLPTREQTEMARDLGSRRAREGLPVEALLDAFHIGFGEAWNALLIKATALDADLAPKLVNLVNLMWSWLRLTSGAAADAHSETLRSQQAIQTSLTHRLLRVLRSGDAHTDEAAHLARALSYDPDGAFQAFCVSSASRPGHGLDRPLQQRLAAQPGVVQAVDQGTVIVILVQDLASEAIITAIGRYDPDLPVGVGLRRRGLAGAAASIVDAERTLALAVRAGGAVDFQNEWLFATLLTHRQHLAPLLQADQGLDGLPTHLVAAVRAYAEHGFSVSAAARALGVHPNTVAYRLDRWQQLTGWTPRTLDGLMKSLLSLRLFPAAESATE
jgi:hypothetical protein